MPVLQDISKAWVQTLAPTYPLKSPVKRNTFPAFQTLVTQTLVSMGQKDSPEQGDLTARTEGQLGTGAALRSHQEPLALWGDKASQHTHIQVGHLASHMMIAGGRESGEYSSWPGCRAEPQGQVELGTSGSHGNCYCMVTLLGPLNLHCSSLLSQDSSPGLLWIK